MRTTVVFALAFVFLAAGSHLSQPTSAQKNDPPQFAEATRLSQMVAELYQKGKYDQALPLAKRVVEMAESTFGPADVHVAVALQNVAEIQLARKNFSDAEKSFDRAVTIFANGPERESEFAVSALRRLATLRYDRRDYKGSAELLARALEIMVKALGRNNPKLVDILWELANAQSANHEFARTEHMALWALLIQEQHLGPANPETIKSMQRYACAVVLIDTGDLKTKDDDSEFTDEERALNARVICRVAQLRDDCQGGRALSSIALARGGVVNDRATHLKLPSFPADYETYDSHGTAYIAVLIDESGKVINAKPVCGVTSSRFVGLSLASARAAVFQPAEVNGKQVQIAGFLTFTVHVR